MPARNALSKPGSSPSLPVGWRWAFAGACVAIILGAFLYLRQRANLLHEAERRQATSLRVKTAGGEESDPHQNISLRPVRAAAHSAEEIVAGKVSQFGRSRLALVHAIGLREKKEVPAEVEGFFEASAAGQWEEIDVQWHALAVRSAQYDFSTNHWPELDPFWPAVLDAYGGAEKRHLWPGRKLLDYGNSILDSLRPGIVYVGGTDEGRWIPELLNETSGGEQHIIVTQNALADSRYLDFVNTLYQDRMTTVNSEESQKIFQTYVADAQKRFEHAQQFPDEPKQVQPGEDIHIVDGKAQVSGRIAVMAINEKLLETLMQKNPGLSFALQE